MDDMAYGYGMQPYGSYGNMMSGMGMGGYGMGQYGTGGMPQMPMNLMQGLQGMQGVQSPQQLQNNQQYGISTLTQGIPNMLAGFGALGNQGGINNVSKMGNNSANLANALTNTNNPLYQQLYGQYKQQNMQNLTEAANMLQGQNRMNAAMGRTPLFARGREGEQSFRNLMQGYENNNINAQNQARGTLMQGLQGSNAALQGNMAANAAQKQQTGNMLGGFSNLADLFKGLGGF
jgi:hypothetical protein